MDYNNWAIGKNKKHALNSVSHRKDFTIIHVNPQDLINKQEPERRVNHADNSNRIGSRFENAIEHFKSNSHMDPPIVAYNRYSGNRENYPVTVDDGRHRIAAAAHLGLKSIPIHVMKSDVKDLKNNLELKEDITMTNILTTILNEDLLNEWYKDRHGNIRPEYEDVEDDLRDGKHLSDIKKTTTVSKALAAGQKYRDSLQKEKQKESEKYSDVKHYRDLPKEENDGVYPSSKNEWHNKIMAARKAGKSIDAHENRAIIRDGFEQRLLHNEINTHQNGNNVVKTKMVKLKHTNPGQETEVHVFKSGLHVPVKERNGQKSYDLTAAYRLRHPSEKLITPSPKKVGV